MYDFLLVVSNFNKGFGIRKLETQAIVLHGLHNHMLSISDRIPTCDRPTDIHSYRAVAYTALA